MKRDKLREDWSKMISTHVWIPLISTHVWIPFFSISYHSLKHCILYNKNVFEHFPNCFKIFRRDTKIAEEDPKMFRLNINLLWYIQHWNRTNIVRKCFEIDIFTCEDNMLFSHVKMWFFSAKDFLVFHWCLYNKYFLVFREQIHDSFTSFIQWYRGRDVSSRFGKI